MQSGRDPSGSTVLSDHLVASEVHAAIDRLAASDEISSWFDSSEESKRIVPPLLDALFEAKLFRLLLPRWLDGFQLNLPELVTAMEALGTIDGSMAWCLGQALGCSLAAAYLDPGVARMVFGPPNAVVAWCSAVSGSAVMVDGGYQLSGTFRYASGMHHATWLGGRSPIRNRDGSERRLSNGSPEIRTLLFPANKASIVEIWNAVGLRATGTDEFTVESLFVPYEHVFFDGDPSQRCDRSPEYALPLLEFYPPAFAGAILGISRAMLSRLEVLAATKTAFHQSRAMRDSPVVQTHIARCESRLGAARAYLLAAVGRAWIAAKESNTVDTVSRRTIRLATSHAFTEAAMVTDVAYHAAGMDAVMIDKGFERLLRDVRTAAQHPQGREEHYESVGRDILRDLADKATPSKSDGHQ
jgi:alkylation response protein AidB-like acyl-CoA dehydrogenase